MGAELGRPPGTVAGFVGWRGLAGPRGPGGPGAQRGRPFPTNQPGPLPTCWACCESRGSE